MVAMDGRKQVYRRRRFLQEVGLVHRLVLRQRELRRQQQIQGLVHPKYLLSCRVQQPHFLERQFTRSATKHQPGEGAGKHHLSLVVSLSACTTRKVLLPFSGAWDGGKLMIPAIDAAIAMVGTRQ